jgi:hypothetical protein
MKVLVLHKEHEYLEEDHVQIIEDIGLASGWMIGNTLPPIPRCAKETKRSYFIAE